MADKGVDQSDVSWTAQLVEKLSRGSEAQVHFGFSFFFPFFSFRF